MMLVQGGIEMVRNAYIVAGRVGADTSNDNHLEERI
jgi:hypothetical protein